MFRIAIFVHIPPRQVTRPIARRMAKTRTSKRRKRQKINPNQRVRTQPQALLVTPAQYWLETTQLYQTFWVAPTSDSFTNRFFYEWNRSFQSDKLLRDITIKQSITANTIWPANQQATTRPCQATYPKWWKLLSRRWRHISSTRAISSLSVYFSLLSNWRATPKTSVRAQLCGYCPLLSKTS